MIDKEIIKIASNTENHGMLNNHTHSSKLKNAICGDEMKIYLIVKNDKITNFKYECESCIYCQASVSLLSRKAKNKSIENVKNFAEHAKNCFEKNTKSCYYLFCDDNFVRCQRIISNPYTAWIDSFSIPSSAFP